MTKRLAIGQRAGRGATGQRPSRRAMGQRAGRRRSYLRRTAALLIAAALATTTAWGTVDAMRTTQTPAPGSTLVVLGDSLTWGTNFFANSQKRLEATKQFEKVIVDSRWGRRISGLNSVRYSGNVALKQLVTSGVRPTAVIVALGTNDVAILNKRREFAAVIQELMTTIGNVPVVWVTVHRVDSASTTRKSQRFNDTLAQVLTNYPLASVYDWVSVAKSNPRVMDPDKIHLTTPLGHEVRTQVYLELATVLAQRAAETTPTTVAPTTTVSASTTVAPTTTVGS